LMAGGWGCAVALPSEFSGLSLGLRWLLAILGLVQKRRVSWRVVTAVALQADVCNDHLVGSACAPSATGAELPAVGAKVVQPLVKPFQRGHYSASATGNDIRGNRPPQRDDARRSLWCTSSKGPMKEADHGYARCGWYREMSR